MPTTQALTLRLCALVLLALHFQFAWAGNSDAEAGIHKVVIQVSTDDARTQSMALNNAVNLQQALGVDNVTIEIVVYGPGLTMLLEGGQQSQRVSSLAKQEITFSACGNTIKAMQKKQDGPVTLSDGVRIVPAGVVRIMELQEQGYAYVRP